MGKSHFRVSENVTFPSFDRRGQNRDFITPSSIGYKIDENHDFHVFHTFRTKMT